MIQVKCTKIIKDTQGNIKALIITDINGNEKRVTENELANAVRNGKINVVNLQLKTEAKESLNKLKKEKEKEKMEVYISNARALGYNIKEIRTNCGHLSYLVSKSETDHIVYIPDDVTNCFKLLGHNYIYGKIKVIGASNVTNMKGMFTDCLHIESLDLSSLDASNVTDMSYMFYNCTSLESLDFSSFDTSKVTGMRAMFWNCTSLESLDLTPLNTSNVTDMEEMFKKCKHLKSLDLTTFNTSKVTDMEEMFSVCTSLKYLDISNFDTSKVQYMRQMFKGCRSLKYLDIQTFDASKVIDTIDMFKGCNAKVKTKDARIIKENPDLCI